MKNFLKLCSLASLFAITLALFPPTLRAQWVYVNDNQQALNTNTAWGFENIPITGLFPIPTEPALGWPTGGTSVSGTDASRDQALYTLGPIPCLFISEPLRSTTPPARPRGDIAAFKVTTGSGVLTFVGRYAPPVGNKGTTFGIGLATGKGTLDAGYTTTNTLQAWTIRSNCSLTPVGVPLAVVPLNGGFIDGMAESHDYRSLVVAYRDGSIQYFATAGTTITPGCEINSAGFTDGNGGMPSGVDITKDSRYAIFGDVTGLNTPHGLTELEVVKLPIICPSPGTTDYGGGITASGIGLGGFIDSTNVWISPDETVIYVTNNGPNAPQGFTTVDFTEPFITGLAGVLPACTLGFTNPTILISPNGGFIEPNGIQTSVTTGNGTRVYVAEYGSPPPSAVALLNVDAVGCTQEAAGSPFADPSIKGGNQLNAWPPRPF